MGAAHVGIGAYWKGGECVAGLEDVLQLSPITERLLKAGYRETDLARILSAICCASWAKRTRWATQ